MKRSMAVLLMVCAMAGAARGQGNVKLPRYPSISPDGKQVVFSWRGDLWIVPSTGGAASRLTAHPFNDLHSAWSPDGKQIAFTSDRMGGLNLFVMNSDGTGVKPVTQSDRILWLVGFGKDEKGVTVLTLWSQLEPEPYSAPRPYAVSPEGGEVDRIFDAYGSFPAVSPDGKKVLFNRGNASWLRRHYRGADNREVWLHDREAKTFSRVTQWNGNDGRGRWVDDQRFIYASDREDRCVNLYQLRVGEDEKQARRLTHFKDADVEDFDVSANGKTVVFARWDALYTLDPADGKAAPRRLEIQADEDEQDVAQLKEIGRNVSESALSPDGKTMAFVAYGEIYVRATEAKHAARRVTNSASREKEIAWSADGAKLYFTSDPGGVEGIYAATVKLSRSEVTRSIAEIRKARAATQPVVGDAGNTNKPGAVVASAEGEAARSEAGSPGTAGVVPATQATAHASTQASTQASTRASTLASTLASTQPATQPLTQPSTRPTEGSRWVDAIAFSIDAVVVGEQNYSKASPSPDGKLLAFRRGNGELMIKELESGVVRPLVKGWSPELDWRWSPDAKHIAYVTEDENYNADVWIIPADGSGPGVNISRHPSNDQSPRWSADGKVLAFLSERINREFDVWMVYLDRELETYTPPELAKYYKEAAAAAKKREPVKAATQPATRPMSRPATQAGTQPTTVASTRPEATTARTGSVPQLDLEDAYLRLRRVTSLAESEGNLELSGGGERYLFTATVGSDRGLYSVDWEGGAPKRIGPAMEVQQMSLGGDQAVIVSEGRGGVVKLPSGEAEYYDIADRIRIDLEAQAEQKFLEAARILGNLWWDPTMGELDWKGVTQKYLELARGTRTASEFDHVANRFLGELNGSHLGVTSPRVTSPQANAIGRLGIRYARVADGFKVTSVLEKGPAGMGPMRMEPDDVITAINLEAFERNQTLDEKLAGTVGKEIVVTVRRPFKDGEARDVHLLVTPISYEKWVSLFYDDWRLATARKVAEMSNGQIGYIHIQGMNQPSLDVFERDLYAAAHGKKGLLIDVRNNGGGWTTDRLLASIMAPNHAYTVARGMDPKTQKGYPNDRLFIARYTLPINLLCNERSFSNAEIVSHAFKTLKRGTLVGQQTAGGVISTGAASLIDGTVVRVPFRGWFLPDGAPQENNGAVPDILVEQRPDDEVKGEDPQLKAAVEDLMKRL